MIKPTKYSTSIPANAIGNGNAIIGLEGTSYDPSWQANSLPTGYYMIYDGKADSVKIYTPKDENELIIFTKSKGGNVINKTDALIWLEANGYLVIQGNTTYSTQDGLVFSLNADDITSYPGNGTTWYGQTEGNSNATIASGVSYNSGGWMTFDGSDNGYVNFQAPELGTTTTVEMWCKIDPGYTSKMFMGWGAYDVYCATGAIGYNTGNSDVYGISQDTVNSLGIVGQWAHYIFEFRSDVSYTNNKIYINGIEQSLSQILGSENSSNRNFNNGSGRIASWSYGGYYMPMDLCGFRVYNRALTPSEIKQNYYQESIVTDGILVNLNASNINSYDKQGTDWKDLSGNNNHTVLTNGPTFEDDYNGIFDFDGSNDQAVFATPITTSTPTSPWTLSRWTYRDPLIKWTSNADTFFGGLNTSTTGWYYANLDASCYVADIQLDGNGDLLVCGNIPTYKGQEIGNFVKLKKNAGIDLTFNVNAGFANSNGSAPATNDIRISSQTGKIYVGGNYNQFGGNTQNDLIRLNTDGTKDTTFNVGSGFNSTVNMVLEDAEGNIYCAGNFTTYNGSTALKLIKIDSNGNRVAAFDTSNGFKLGTSTSTSSVYVLSIRLSDDGQYIYVGGSFDNYQGQPCVRMARLRTSDGSLDTSFDMSVGFNNIIRSIRGVNEDIIYVGGDFTTVHGVSKNKIVGINSIDGSINDSFNVGNGFSNGSVYKINIDSQGRIYVGGSFSSSYNGTGAAYRMVRINQNGTRDTSFNIGSGFNSTVYDIEIDGEDNLYVGGNFTTYNGQYALRIIKLLSDGTRDNTFLIQNSTNDAFDECWFRSRFIYYYKNSTGAITSYSWYITPWGSQYRRWKEVNDYWCNQWNNWTLTMDSSGRLKGYRNGTLVYNNTGLSTALERGLNITKIGAYGSSSVDYGGKVANVLIYDRDLTEEEVTQNFEAQRKQFGV